MGPLPHLQKYLNVKQALFPLKYIRNYTSNTRHWADKRHIIMANIQYSASYVSGPVLNAFNIVTYFIIITSLWGNIILISIFRLGNWDFREVKWFAKGYSPQETDPRFQSRGSYFRAHGLKLHPVGSAPPLPCSGSRRCAASIQTTVFPRVIRIHSGAVPQRKILNLFSGT